MKAIIIVPLICIGFFTGCSDIFRINLFRSFEDTSSTISNKTTVSDIDRYSESPEFYDSLKNDPGKKGEVITILNESMRSGTPEQKQEASLLLADVYTKSDPAATEIIQNVVTVLLDEADMDGSGNPAGLSSSSDPTVLLKALLPSELLPGENPPGSSAYEAAKESFKETLASLAGAGDAYNVFGLALDPENDKTIVQPDPDINMGAVAQDALICITVSVVLDVMMPGNPAEAADQLFDAMFGNGSVPSGVQDLDLQSMNDRSAGLSNIMTAAGMSELFPSGSEEFTGGKS